MMPAGQVLPAKEQGLFKQVVKLYETKQYKKGLKAAEQVLKRFPDHGETLAMKGLTLKVMDKDRKEEVRRHSLAHSLTQRPDRRRRRARGLVRARASGTPRGRGDCIMEGGHVFPCGIETLLTWRGGFWNRPLLLVVRCARECARLRNLTPLRALSVAEPSYGHCTQRSQKKRRNKVRTKYW